MPVFDCYSNLGGSLVPGIAHNTAAITATMVERRVDAAVLFSAHARHVDPIAGNRILRAMVEQAPNLFACLYAHPNRTDASITAMRDLVAARKFVGMCIAGADLTEPIHRIVADDLLNAYRRYGKPLFLHALNGKSVAAALDIARSYPVLKVVLLGMGGADWRAAIAAAHTATNIYLDTSGTLDRSKLSAAIDALGVHRIIFGSGAPQTDPAAVLGLVGDCPISDEMRRRILWDNAVRLLDLDLQPA